MVVSRLRHRRPQHQGQAEPRQPSKSKPHAFLHRARFSLAYNGCVLQGNAGQVTMGTDCYVWPLAGLPGRLISSEGINGRTNLRRTKSEAVAIGKRSRSEEA